MAVSRKMWVFLVAGGESFAVQTRGNPAMRHDGSRSLLRCLCTDVEASVLEETMRRHGATVSRSCPDESAEQRSEREHVLSLLGDGRPFPCTRCPECAWFDPHVEGLCGAGLAGAPGWTADAIASAKRIGRHHEDFKSCPLQPKDAQLASEA